MPQHVSFLLKTLAIAAFFPLMAQAASAGSVIDLADNNPPASGTGWTYSSSEYSVQNNANVTVTGTNTSERGIEVATNAAAKITLSNATLTGSLWLSDDANLELVLEGTNTINAATNYAGVQAPKGTKLTIDGTGSLNATGGNYAAGIGGRGGTSSDLNGRTAGTIIINGGTITANGGNRAAGIGGGYNLIGSDHGVSGGSGGNIEINGGTITANGGGTSYVSAGIGGGAFGYGGSIVINGGTVNAVGVVGIGGNSGKCNIEINGGTVYAKSEAAGASGAAIGSFGSTTNNVISITGGSVNAKGGASTNDIDAAKGTVSITGGSVYAANGKIIGFATPLYPVKLVFQIFSASPGTTMVTPASYTNPAPAGGNYTSAFDGTLEANVAWLWLPEGKTPIIATNGTEKGRMMITVAATTNMLTINDFPDYIIDFAEEPTLSINWTYNSSTKVYTLQNGADVIVTGTNADGQRIVVAAGATARITLENATIANLSANQSPILLNSGANAELTLEGTNTLTAGPNSAGIQAPAGTTLAIGGPDTLTVNAGDLGAGIGGGNGEGGGNITINGGVIRIPKSINNNYTGGSAGIGGGNDGNGGNVVINGGTIDVSGNGSYSSYIPKYHGPSIGSGGNVAETAMNNGTLIIDGGSVNRINTMITSCEAVAKNSKGDNVYRVQIMGNPSMPSTAITAGSISGVSYYGMKDVKTNSGGRLFFWLPEGTDLFTIIKTGSDTYVGNVSSSSVENLEAVLPVAYQNAIATAALPGGIYGTAYSEVLTAPAYPVSVWSITSGALPTGLSLDPATGVISGTFQRVEMGKTFYFTVKAENLIGSVTKELSIFVGAPDNATNRLQMAINTATGTAQNPTVITITEDIPDLGPITIPAGSHVKITSDGTTRVLTRGEVGSLFDVRAGGSLVLENIVIDGNKSVIVSNFVGSLVVVSGDFVMGSGAVLQNNNDKLKLGGGVLIYDDTFTVGGTAKITGNTPSNVFLTTGQYITLNNPALGMEIGVAKTADDGVFVQSGATPSDAQYFTPDESGKFIMYENGTLKIADDNATNRLQHAINSATGTAQNPTVITIENATSLRQIRIPSGSHVKLTGEQITRNSTAVSTLFTINAGGSLVLENIVIDGNNASTMGPLVLVYGDFVMNSGTVLQNNINDWGRSSGVYVNGGSFTMNDGKISGNSASSYGGGVYVQNGTFIVGGTAEITGNLGLSNRQNVYLDEGAYITLATGSGAPAAGMEINVSTHENNNGVIVQSDATPSDAKYFIADEGGDYKVGFGPDGSLVISDNTLSVTYDGNGNTSGSVPIDNVPYISGATVTLLDANSLEKTGYLFKGWDYYATFIITDNTTINAVWVEDNATNRLQAKINASNGTEQNPAVIAITENIPDLGEIIIPDGKHVKITSDATTRTLTREKSSAMPKVRAAAQTGTLFMVSAGSTLVLENIIIDGNTAIDNSKSPLIASFGTLIIKDGTVLQNNTVDDAKFVISAVSIDGGEFIMNGGTITNNTTTNPDGLENVCGGVIVFDGTFIVGGTAKITGNSVDGAEGNVCLAEDMHIILNNPLPGMKIGVTKTDNNGVIVQSGATPSDAKYFIADEARKTVGYGNGVLQISSTVYTVTYNGNGSTGGTAPIDDTPYISGATATVLGRGDLEKANYYFNRWDSQADGNGTPYPSGSYYIASSKNTELYAIWSSKTKIAKPTLTQSEFAYNGEEKTVKLSNTTQHNYVLEGATTETNAGNYIAYARLLDPYYEEWADGTTENILFDWKINKATPSYTTPTGLKATYGDPLSTVTLPSDWAWEGTGTVGNAGTQTHKATFTPTDTDNYNTVENINIAITVSKATFSGEGTEASPYLISTAQQLANLATLVNSGNTHYSAAHYKLQNNIDISEYDSNWNNGEGWIPIGNEYLGISFSGIFDGAGKAISGLFIYGTGYNVGLFGAVQGTVKNLGVVNVNLYDNSGSAVGSIVGLLHGPDSKIINCYSSGTLYSTTYAGGIVGYVFGGGTVTGNIALNQWVKSTYIINHAGRVVGRASGTNTISDNFAWAGMTTNGGVDFTDETTLLSSVEVVLKSKDFGIAEVPQYIIDDLPSLSGATITHNATYAYTGSAITPNITVTLDGSVLTKGVHYSITALANNTSAGEASFSIAAITPFKGTKAGNAFTITKVNPIVPAAPANLTAKEGQKLAEIALPQNWHWMKETEYVGKVGEQTHQAKYVPTDTENYNTIENIDVKITVSSELTPIAHHVPYPMSHVPKYYTLKGIPLGTAKPTAPGVYIVKIGTQTQRVVVK